MKKKDAEAQLEKLQKEVDKLREIINKPVDLFSTIKSYSNVCEELGEKERTQSEFLTKKEWRFHQIQNVAKLFNGTSTNNNYYPWFRKNGSGGLAFLALLLLLLGLSLGMLPYIKMLRPQILWENSL